MSEKEHFIAMYESLKDEFPKICTCCEKIFTTELDYNSKTHHIEGHIDVEELGLGRIFIRNCEDPCNTSLALKLNHEKFGIDDSIKFMTYIGARAKREEKNATEILDFFRKEYNQWLENHEENPNKIILGTDNTTELNDYLSNLRIKDTAIINPERLRVNTSLELREDVSDKELLEQSLGQSLKVIKRNPGRVSLALIHPDMDYIQYHEKIVNELREQDGDFKKHTPILAYSSIDNLSGEYVELDIDEVIDPNSSKKESKKIIESYLFPKE